MSQKYLVFAQDRTAQGFNHVVCAGRWFASVAPTPIEVLDQDDDVMVKADKPDYPDVPELHKCGRLAFKRIQADPRLTIKVDGPEIGSDVAVELATVKAELAEARSAVEKLTAAVEASEAEKAKLVAEVAELKALLEVADKPAPLAAPKPQTKGERPGK
jgi:hypothetical protein